MSVLKHAIACGVLRVNASLGTQFEFATGGAALLARLVLEQLGCLLQSHNT